MNGFILHETKTRVIIVTGTTRPSSNSKTGPMLQVWVLNRNVSPIDATKTGEDRNICGTCPHKGTIRMRKTRRGWRVIQAGRKRTCYVNLRTPQAIWKAYKRGSYPRLKMADYPKVFGGKRTRLGAYGDPFFIPAVIVRAICKTSDKHTGYTHQWEKPAAAFLRPFVMASCETPGDYIKANQEGWRTFRVAKRNAAALPNEIACPASKEQGHKTQCHRCTLCNGASTLKNVFIAVHGPASKTAELTILQ
jgi:hypothetical protein